MGEETSVTDQAILALKAGRPISAMSVRQTFGVHNFKGLVWNIRIRGHHLVGSKSWGTSKLDGSPVSFVEYRLREEGNEVTVEQNEGARN